ncbi:MAG: sulfatase [Acidobacteria bacterium]|nr:sulfatase [Acidobacteriota bacterium]
MKRGEYSVLTPGTSTPEGLSFFETPRLEDVTVDFQRRPAVVLPAGRWAWKGRVPKEGRLFVGAAALGEKRAIPGSFAVSVDSGSGPEIVAEVRRPRAGKSWVDFEVDMARWAGREAKVELLATFVEDAPPEVAWGPVALQPGELRRRAQSQPPNIVLIVVDTLRHDHLSSYGYGRPTTPRIDALLADRGVLFEDAYAQAPWTLPSVVSMLTGRYPTELLPERQAAYRIPDDVPSLSEMLGALGYETAAFYANPALHEETGFGRGFSTFFAPPASFDWFERHADDLNGRLLPWVRSHRRGPFFLYAHYLDPHDPYDNPDVVDGQSPFNPGYDGPLTGHSVHRIYGGFDPLPDPARDVPQLTALYDSEVAYVDRFVGQLLEALGPDVLANTLVIFTSDHGEELYDHGGWKHGQSLYEEQIHVPLLLRWDGHLPAGRRIPGTVELLDVVPTAMAAAGGTADPLWQGVNLLPAARGETPLKRRTAFFQHLAAGPLRAGTVIDGRKLILFNRREPFEPPDPFQDYLWKKDLSRFQDVELYDLGADPSEKKNLARDSPELLRQLAAFVHRRLDRRFPGLRLRVDGLAEGQGLSGKLRFEIEPDGWDPYFLGPEDRVELDGKVLTFELSGTPGSVPGRGVFLRGSTGSVEPLDLRLDGEAMAPSILSYGDGHPWTGGVLTEDELEARRWPAPQEGPGLQLWLPSEAVHLEEGEEDEETVRRLKALGYLLQ